MRKLLTTVKLTKPYSKMTEYEEGQLAAYIAAQAKAIAKPLNPSG